jgi:hypothetical protein
LFEGDSTNPAGALDSGALPVPGDKGEEKKDQKDEEEHFGNSRCRHGNTGKSEKGGDQSNYQKNNGPS